MGLGSFMSDIGESLGGAGSSLGAGAGYAFGGPGGALIGSGIGGTFDNAYNQKLGRQQQAENIEVQRQLFGQNWKNQREFAQKSLLWKMQQAKKIGIHPLAAMGASLSFGSPVSVGDTSPNLASLGGNMGNIGQDLGRAIAATQSPHEKKITQLQIENAEIDNEMKKIELLNAQKSAGLQAGNGGVTKINAEVTKNVPGRKDIEAGRITQTGYMRNDDGSLTPVPSKDAKERIEDQIIPEMVWSAKNYSGLESKKPPREYLPKGAKDWQWSYSRMSWIPVDRKGRSLWQRWSDYVTDWQRPKHGKRSKFKPGWKN